MPETRFGCARGRHRGLRWASWLAAALVVPCVSCTSKSVELQNPKTGEKTSCSVYYPAFGEPARARMVEMDECIREHRTRGFAIVSPPQQR
jgi:hypothetical protein